MITGSFIMISEGEIKERRKREKLNCERWSMKNMKILRYILAFTNCRKLKNNFYEYAWM